MFACFAQLEKELEQKGQDEVTALTEVIHEKEVNMEQMSEQIEGLTREIENLNDFQVREREGRREGEMREGGERDGGMERESLQQEIKNLKDFKIRERERGREGERRERKREGVGEKKRET